MTLSLVTLLAYALLTTPVEAHVTSTSRAQVTVEGADVRYQINVNPVDLALAVGLIDDAATPFDADQLMENLAEINRYVSDRLTVYGDDSVCEPGPISLKTGEFPASVRLTVFYTCPAPPERLLIQYLLFFELDTHHAAIGTVVTGNRSIDFVLSFDEPELVADLRAGEGGLWSQAGRFFLFGVEHILIGYDHVLFLIGLIVASLRLRYLLTVVSMFTVAHTVTLLLAATGYVQLPGRLVESMIALSIAYIAVENLTGRGMRFRWAITFGFGLVHGLGFASVLADLTGGGEAHVLSLLTFNLGVEGGQLLIVGVVYPLLLLLDRWGLHKRVMRVASMIILAAALYWLVERVFGL